MKALITSIALCLFAACEMPTEGDQTMPDIVSQRLRIPAAYEQVLPAIPADLVVNTSNFISQGVANYATTYGGSSSTISLSARANSQIVIRNIGIFSNFADGLVFKNANSGFAIQFTIEQLYREEITGTFNSFTAGSKTITGSGTLFTSEINTLNNDNIQIEGAVYRVASVTNDTTLEVTQYPMASEKVFSDLTAYRVKSQQVSMITSRDFNLGNIRQLNEMIPVNYYSEGFDSGIPDGATNLGLFVTASLVREASPLEFLTKSIDTSFAGDTAFFDIVLDVEFGR